MTSWLISFMRLLPCWLDSRSMCNMSDSSQSGLLPHNRKAWQAKLSTCDVLADLLHEVAALLAGSRRARAGADGPVCVGGPRGGCIGGPGLRCGVCACWQRRLPLHGQLVRNLALWRCSSNDSLEHAPQRWEG